MTEKQPPEGVDLTEAIAAFKTAWHAADERGEVGARVSAGLTAALPAIEAAIRERVSDEIKASVPLGFGMNYDGTEDRETAAYVEAIADAARIARDGAK